MSAISMSVKSAELLQPGDVVNVNGVPLEVEHVSINDFVSIIPKEGGRVVRYKPGYQVEYVTAEQWAAI